MKVLLTIVLISCVQMVQSQTGYLAGTADVSIEPDSSLFSVALAGYGGPREGRFSLEWVAVKKEDADMIKTKLVDAPALERSTSDTAYHIISTCTDGKRWYALSDNNILYARKTGNTSWLKIARKNGFTYDIDARHIFIVNDRLYALDNNQQLFIARHGSENNLSATALAIKKDKQTVVIVGVDLVGFDYTLSLDVKKEISRKRKIAPDAVFINCSHTHYAPVTQKFPCWQEHGQLPDSNYMHQLKAGIVQAIEEALDHLAPAKLYFGRGTTEIGYNRCLSDGLYDNTVDVVKVVGNNGKIKSVLFLTACHPVFKNEGKEGYTMSPNFPGVTRQLLKSKLHAEHAIFLQGCAGDINPRDADHVKTGLKLAIDVVSVLSGNMTELKGGLSADMDSVLAPVRPWEVPAITKFKSDNDNRIGDVYAEKNVRWANLMLNYYNKDQMPKTMPVYVQSLSIGNWKLVGISREVVTDYSVAVKKLWSDKFVTVAGYTNDISSYLPAQRHIKAHTYEGFDSFFWYGQPCVFPENIQDTIVGAIKKLK